MAFAFRRPPNPFAFEQKETRETKTGNSRLFRCLPFKVHVRDRVPWWKASIRGYSRQDES
jgi:hypothetical protein